MERRHPQRGAGRAGRRSGQAQIGLACIAELLDGALPPALRRTGHDHAGQRGTRSSPRSWSGCSSTAGSCSRGRWTAGELVGPDRGAGGARLGPGGALGPARRRCQLDEKRVAQEASVVGRIFWDHRGRPRSGPSDAERFRSICVACASKELVAPRAPSTVAPAPASGPSTTCSCATWPTSRCPSPTAPSCICA